MLRDATQYDIDEDENDDDLNLNMSEELVGGCRCLPKYIGKGAGNSLEHLG